MNSSASLLPNGLVDLLPPNAENEARAIAAFIAEFAAFGYARVKPPLVEFEESLLGEGPGQKLARQTFRMMDPVSQKMMGVRADVTAQIARIATSRLAGEERPLRLSYAADVLRVNGTQLRSERQFCQVGCEMIGADTFMADVEMPLVALKALSSVGLKKLSIDLTVPTLVAHIYDETGASDEEKKELDYCIEKRDLGGVGQVEGKAASLVFKLMDTKDFDKVALPKNAQADMDRLLATAKELRAALDVYGLSDIQITIDPLERRGFEYQTGVSFTLFAIGARGELGRGGRYDVTVRGKAPETATGFTLYMDTILKVVPPMAEPQKQSVSASAGWGEVKALQDRGIQVSRKG